MFLLHSRNISSAVNLEPSPLPLGSFFFPNTGRCPMALNAPRIPAAGGFVSSRAYCQLPPPVLRRRIGMHQE